MQWGLCAVTTCAVLDTLRSHPSPPLTKSPEHLEDRYRFFWL